MICNHTQHQHLYSSTNLRIESKKGVIPAVLGVMDGLLCGGLSDV